MLQQQRQSLPDLGDYRRAAREREDKAAKIGVRRLRHREEEQPLRDLDAYVAGLSWATRRPSRDAAAARTAPRARRDRKGLLDKAIEADDVYLRKLGELESVQRRLLDAIEDYDAFLDEHLLWVRSTSLFQLEQLSALSDQMWRVLSPTGWRDVVRTLAYQATHSPVYALLAVALALLLWGRRRLIAAIQDLSDKLGKPTTDHFGYTLAGPRADR